MSISNELRGKKMTNDFNKMINENLKELINKQIKDKIDIYTKEINELKIFNEMLNKKL